ncbi:MAG: gas vesicle protein [Bacteroidales bacterium]|nr:gas vesicle protein [Bacteroidales bacterium]MCF8338283.1 gas vesicle protein [Bacteroidales bacterium]
MSKITDVKNVALNFLKEEIKCYEPKVVEIKKVDDTWESVAEVYEDDSFLKSMNLPPKKERVFYLVNLNDNLEIIGYKRLTSYEEEKSE